MRRFPSYKDTLARANNEAELAFTAVEQQDFPTDHATIGCLLAQNWWLSDDLCQAIRYHHDQPAIELFESGMPLISRYLVAISQLAEHLLQKITGESHTEEWSKLGPSCLRLLSLEEADLPALYEEASMVLIEMD
jgi:HD-like signal output (HDOD) protein